MSFSQCVLWCYQFESHHRKSKTFQLLSLQQKHLAGAVRQCLGLSWACNWHGSKFLLMYLSVRACTHTHIHTQWAAKTVLSWVSVYVLDSPSSCCRCLSDWFCLSCLANKKLCVLGQAAFDWASLPLSLCLSLSLQSGYDRFAAELHLYACVYLLINDLVMDGLHGMLYGRGGCSGKCDFVGAAAVWARKRPHIHVWSVLAIHLSRWPKNKAVERYTSAPSPQNNVL